MYLLYLILFLASLHSYGHALVHALVQDVNQKTHDLGMVSLHDRLGLQDYRPELILRIVQLILLHVLYRQGITANGIHQLLHQVQLCFLVLHSACVQVDESQEASICDRVTTDTHSRLLQEY